MRKSLVKHYALCLLVASLPLSLSKAEDCSDILSMGIHDELSIENFSEYQSAFSEVMKMSFSQLKKEAEKGHGEASVAMGILKVTGGGGGEEQRFEELKKTFESDKRGFFSSKSFNKILLKTINPSIVQAWSDCTSGKNLMDFYTGDPADEFIVAIKYVRRMSGQPELIKVGDVEWTSNLEPVTNVFKGVKFKEGTELPSFAFITQKFKRLDKTKPASVLIDFSGNGNVKLVFPAVLPPPPPPPPPVPVEILIRENVSTFGDWQKIHGDYDMNTNSNDVVPATCSTTLSATAEQISVKISYRCDEYKGDGTVYSGTKEYIIYKAPKGNTIKSISHKGRASQTYNGSTRRQNHGLNDFEVGKTYWNNLKFRVDSPHGNDKPYVGVVGEIELHAILE